MISPIDPEPFDIDVGALHVHGLRAGSGPPLLLLHGWPHTSLLWRKVMPALAEHHDVIAPDLRGTGGTTKAVSGYDLHTLAGDASGLLDALGAHEPAGVVGIDAGAPVAWMFARRHPERTTHLAVMESLLGTLPGAEAFLGGGPPWWFGFHAVPGLAEVVVEGHEAAYLDWFFRSGTVAGSIDDEARDAFVAAYTGREALRGGFEHYRAMAGNAALVAEAASAEPHPVPTLAIAGGTVGDALAGQLAPITAQLTAVAIPGCRHLIPEEQPEALVAVLASFLGGPAGS